MIFTPSAKALVYNELQFIATSRPVAVNKPSIAGIFDDVFQEIQALFLEAPEVRESLVVL